MLIIAEIMDAFYKLIWLNRVVSPEAMMTKKQTNKKK